MAAGAQSGTAVADLGLAINENFKNKAGEMVEQTCFVDVVVWGRQDAIVPLNCGEIYARALPNASLHVIDNCGHSPANERPNDFLQAVLPFVTAA